MVGIRKQDIVGSIDTRARADVTLRISRRSRGAEFIAVSL